MKVLISGITILMTFFSVPSFSGEKECIYKDGYEIFRLESEGVYTFKYGKSST
jgi:hypothetical protein